MWRKRKEKGCRKGARARKGSTSNFAPFSSSDTLAETGKKGKKEGGEESKEGGGRKGREDDICTLPRDLPSRVLCRCFTAHVTRREKGGKKVCREKKKRGEKKETEKDVILQN